MLICQHNAEFAQMTGEEEDCDWSLAAKEYPDLREMPSFIAQQRQEFVVQSFTTSADPSHLQGKQLLAYSAVREHSESSNHSQSPLRMVVRHSRNGKVVPHTVSQTPAERSPLRCSTHWCSCL